MMDFKEVINRNFNDYTHALDELVQVESVEGNSEVNAPFGKGPRKALDRVLKIAEKWGFDTYHCDHAVGYAEWVNDPDTDEYVGVLGHVDVVPAGTGWDSDPFKLTIIDNMMYGRGVLDNKGPALASLFALKLLKESGVSYGKNIRVIFGTNEESGSKDIPFYLKNNEPPMYGFTPDSQFPAVYGEKGVVSVRFSNTFTTDPSIQSIEGDFISSSVPDKARLCLKNGRVTEYSGIRAPSNEPQLGKNALTLLADKNKSSVHLKKEEKELFRWISDIYHEKHHGEGLVSGDVDDWEIQITPYTLQFNDRRAVFELSLRYSVEKTEKEIVALIKRCTPRDVSIEIIRSFPPIVFDRKHPMLSTMKEVYEEVSGLDGEPLITTGATYARFMPNIIAFGPSFPGQIGIAHNSNEWMAVNDMKMTIEIYAKVMDKLLK